MANRKQKIQDFMEGFQSLKRRLFFHAAASPTAPRITPSQWSVLMLLGHRGGSTVKDVAEALGISSSGATQLIDGLAASGYVLRQASPKDRRAVLLTLSKKTKTHVDKMRRQALQACLKLFAVLDDKEFDQYIRLNKKIVERTLS